MANAAYTNADDGNLNYDQFDVYSTNAKVTFDVEMQYEVQNEYLVDVGTFIRATAFYDVIGNCAHCTQRTDLAPDCSRTFVVAARKGTEMTEVFRRVSSPPAAEGAQPRC